MSASVEIGPAGISNIVNEGPVGPDFRLEDTMILAVNEPKLLGEIPQVFLEAFETPESKARRIYEELRNQPSLTEEMLHRAFLAAAAVGKSPRVFGWPRADLEYVTSVLQGQSVEAEAKVLDKTIAGFPIPHAQEKKTTQAIYANRVEQKRETHLEYSNEEEVEIRRKRFVLDERALGAVIVEIRQAVRKASVLAQRLGRKITGPLITRFLPGQHQGNESEAVKGKGRDGSIPERAQAINNHGEYATEAEAEEKSIKEAYGKPPIKVRNEGEGEPVKDEAVYRVFQKYEVKPVLIEEERLAEVFGH